MGLYRATVHGTLFGQTVDVITGWEATPATNAGDANTIAQRVFTNWGTYIMANTVDDYEITSCDVIGMDDPTVFGFYSGSTTGGNGTDPGPAFTVANVKLTTGLRGRSYTGRFGIPGLPVSAFDTTDGNVLASGFLSAFQTAVSDFITHVNTGPPTPQLAVISTISGGTPRPTPIGTVVTTAAVQALLGSRVSRKG